MYIPGAPLIFTNGRLLIFKSTNKSHGPAKMAKFPAVIGFFSIYKIGFNVWDSHKMRAVMWMLPLVMSLITRANLF